MKKKSLLKVISHSLSSSSPFEEKLDLMAKENNTTTNNAIPQFNNNLYQYGMVLMQ